MMINQRGNATGVNVSGNYGIDRFYSEMGNSISGNWSIGQSTDVPVGSGVENSLEYGCTTTSSNADRYLMTIYRMEGYDSQVFNYGTPYAKDVTLSFWIKCSKAGNFQVNFENEDNPDQGYQTKQTIHKSGTWEKKVVTIPGDTTKGFPSTSAKAMCFDIMYSAFGSQRTGATPTAEWSALSNTQRGTHCDMDLFDSLSNYVKIAGVQLELGKNATEFEHRSYGEELALCQRYYFKLSNSRLIMGYKRHDTSANFAVECPVPMRASPTPTLTAGGTFTNFQSNFNTTQSSPNVYEWNSVSGNRFLFQVASTWSSTHSFVPSWEGFTAEFSAEI